MQATRIIERIVAKNNHFVGPNKMKMAIEKGRSYVICSRNSRTGMISVNTPEGGWFGWTKETKF